MKFAGFGLQSNDSIQSISHPPSPLTAATEGSDRSPFFLQLLLCVGLVWL